MQLTFSLFTWAAALLTCLLASVTPTTISRTLEKYVAVSQIANPSKKVAFEVHPHTIFDDSLDYITNHLPEFRKDPFVNVRFKDDSTIDPSRWLHGMALDIFAPSSRLFIRQPGQHHHYAIYTGPTLWKPSVHEARLRAAGRFVAKVAQLGRILNQRLAPEIHARLLQPNAKKDPTQARLLAFTRGFHDIIPPEELCGLSLGNLAGFIHGLAFEELPEWRPIITPRGDKNQSALQSIAHFLSLAGRHLVIKLWRLVTGMEAIPLQELNAPRGIMLGFDDPEKSNILGLSADLSSHSLDIGPGVDEDYIVSVLDSDRFEEILTHVRYTCALERMPPSDRVPEVELTLGTGDIVDVLAPLITNDLHLFVKSRIIFTDQPRFGYMDNHQFFLFALPRLIRQTPGLFTELFVPSAITNEESPHQSMLEICPDVVSDERRHRDRLFIAGVILGKALSHFQAPFLLSPPLCALLHGDDVRIGGGRGGKLWDRSIAFVNGIYEVIPRKIFESIPLEFISLGLTDPTYWARQAMTSLRMRGRVFWENNNDPRTAELHWNMLLRALEGMGPTQLSLFSWQLYGSPAISLGRIMGQGSWELIEFDNSSPLNVLEVLKGLIQCPAGSMDDPQLARLALAPTMPTRLLEMAATGIMVATEPEREIHMVVAPLGQVFRSLLDAWQLLGRQECTVSNPRWGVPPPSAKRPLTSPTLFFLVFSKYSVILLILDGEIQIAEHQNALDCGFLALAEASREDFGLFRYDYQPAKGERPGLTVIEHGPRSDANDDGRQLDELYFAGALLANLVVAQHQFSELPLCERLIQLLYWGPSMQRKGASPPSAGENAFIEGFYSIVSPSAIQLIPYPEWRGLLSPEAANLCLQRGLEDSYAYFLEVGQLLLNQKSPGQSYPTWDDQVGAILSNPSSCKCRCHAPKPSLPAPLITRPLF